MVRYAQIDKEEGIFLLYLGLLLLAGILQGIMVSLNGQMGNYFSLFGICFFVHAIALVLLFAYLLAKRQTLRFAGAPWYVYLVGVMGIAIVASSSWCTLHVGASAFMALSTAGQLVSSALIDRFGLTQEEAAARVGKSRPAVANALRLLLLPEEVRSLVEDGTISAGHARAILSLPAARLQKAAAQKIVALRLSVRQAEAMCKRMLQEEEKPEPKPAPLTVDYVAECEKSLTRRLDRKVRIVNGKRKGRFELEFYGQEDLQRLYDALLALGKTEETPECLN